MEKMNSNRVKNSTLHLDSEIVHILSHLSLYVFFSFFAWAICSQHHTLPLKTSVEFLKKKDSCLHNHSFIITPRKINNCTFILVHIYTFPNVTSLIAGIFKNYVPVKVHTLHLVMFVSHFYSRRIFPYTHTFFSFFLSNTAFLKSPDQFHIYSISYSGVVWMFPYCGAWAVLLSPVFPEFGLVGLLYSDNLFLQWEHCTIMLCASYYSILGGTWHQAVPLLVIMSITRHRAGL